MRPKVLCIDDSKDMLLLLRLMLEDRFEVITCFTADEASEQLARQSPDVILLDVQLADPMESFGWLSRIKMDPAHRGIPIIAFTAHAMMGHREKFLAMGFDGYISKPIMDEDDFVATIRQFISARGAAEN